MRPFVELEKMSSSLDPFYDDNTLFLSTPTNALGESMQNASMQNQNASMQNASMQNPPMPMHNEISVNPLAPSAQPLGPVGSIDSRSRRLRNSHHQRHSAPLRYPSSAVRQPNDAESIEQLLRFLGKDGEFVKRTNESIQKINKVEQDLAQFRQENARLHQENTQLRQNIDQIRSQFDEELTALRGALMQSSTDFTRRMIEIGVDPPEGMDTPIH